VSRFSALEVSYLDKWRIGVVVFNIDGADWVALSGCMPEECGTRHGLLLIGPGGDRLLARIDDGGFTREYGYGPGMVTFRPPDRAVVNAAWNALGVKAAKATG
jgi:hypothetical protein